MARIVQPVKIPLPDGSEKDGYKSVAYMEGDISPYTVRNRLQSYKRTTVMKEETSPWNDRMGVFHGNFVIREMRHRPARPVFVSLSRGRDESSLTLRILGLYRDDVEDAMNKFFEHTGYKESDILPDE